MATCLHCNESFEPRTAAGRFCSERCMRHYGYLSRRELAWQPGFRVWVASKGAWRTGLIESRPSQNSVAVRTDESELVITGIRPTCLRYNPPEPGTPIPVARRASKCPGLLDLYELGPRRQILRRKPGIWSSKAPACLDCGTTEKPHMAFGLCANCYANWRYRTNYHGTRDHSIARAKRYSLTEKAQAFEEERRARRQADPAYRLYHREVSRRWAQRHAKWPISGIVWVFDAGQWIRGEILRLVSRQRRIVYLEGGRLMEICVIKPEGRITRTPPYKVMSA